MAVERLRAIVSAKVDTRVHETEPLCGRLLGYAMVGMALVVLFFAAMYGGGAKMKANSFPSPWEAKVAAPPPTAPESVNVTVLPKAMVMPRPAPYRAA